MPYKDPEKARECRRKWREANREKDRESKKRYKEKNKEKIKEQGKEYKKREDVKERTRKQLKEYYIKHKDEKAEEANKRYKKKISLDSNRKLISSYGKYENDKLTRKQRKSISAKLLGFTPQAYRNNKSTGIKNIYKREFIKEGISYIYFNYIKKINGIQYNESFKTLEEAIKYKEWFEETHYTEEQKEIRDNYKGRK